MNKSDEMDGELVGMGITHDNCPDPTDKLMERINYEIGEFERLFNNPDLSKAIGDPSGILPFWKSVKSTIEALQKEDELACATISKLSGLLTGVVNAIKGEPLELTLWSFHDAPELVEALQEEKASMQAKIDSLMFEFCPDEMTEQQVAEFEKHQVVAEDKFDLTEHAKGDSSDE